MNRSIILTESQFRRIFGGIINESESEDGVLTTIKKKEFDRYILLGDKYFDEKNYEKSLENYNNALRLFGNRTNSKNYKLALDKIETTQKIFDEHKKNIKNTEEKNKDWLDKQEELHHDNFEPSYNKLISRILWTANFIDGKWKFSFYQPLYKEEYRPRIDQNTGDFIDGDVLVSYRFYTCSPENLTISHEKKNDKYWKFSYTQEIKIDGMSKDTETKYNLDLNRYLADYEFEKYQTSGESAYNLLIKDLM